MKKEYIYISIIILAFIALMAISIKNLKTSTQSHKQNISSEEIFLDKEQELIDSNCDFSIDKIWQGKTNNAKICKNLIPKCTQEEFFYNNICGCGCINIE